MIKLYAFTLSVSMLNTPAFACRYPVNQHGVVQPESLWRAADFKAADVVVLGTIIALPVCQPESPSICDFTVIPSKVEKGPSMESYSVRDDGLSSLCRPTFFEPSVRGTFYLYWSEDRYFLMRSEKSSKR